MYSVRKIFRVPIGHRLMKHEGLCKNIHGHNLKIEVQLSCNCLNDNDMVIDFKDLKRIVSDILNEFDHCTIFNSYDENNIQFFTHQGYKCSTLSSNDQDPTAEIFCKYLLMTIDKKLTDFNSRNQKVGSPLQTISVDFVRVWENDDSMAEYKE